MGKDSTGIAPTVREQAKGYDVSGVKPQGMLPQGLSSHRELVEQLDPELIYDYLRQNGVLEDHEVAEVRQERSPAKVNLSLLTKVEEHGKSAEGLLIIALRQSGQHYLANLLDDTDRIKALSGSGYLSKSRHKGQLSVKIAVRAIKLSSDSYKTSSGELLHSREWLSLEDFTQRNLTNSHNSTDSATHQNLTNGQSSTDTSIPQFEVAEPSETGETHKKSNCICGCFAKLFSKSKVKQLDSNTMNSSGTKAKSKEQKYIATNEGQVSRESRTSIKRANSERLLNLENLFRQKVSEFYTLLNDATSDAHTLLLKYFEQDRSLLVLDTSFPNDGIMIVTISTTLYQFQNLRQDYHSGKLTSDLEKWLITEKLLQTLGANGIKINVDCQSDELEQAEQELS